PVRKDAQRGVRADARARAGARRQRRGRCSLRRHRSDERRHRGAVLRHRGGGRAQRLRPPMPLARIEVRRSRPAAEVEAMIDAVYEAQREALKVPEGDRLIRYVEHDPLRFAVPPGKSENYTLVEIVMFPGRSREAKRNLYRSIVRRFGAL